MIDVTIGGGLRMSQGRDGLIRVGTDDHSDWLGPGSVLVPGHLESIDHGGGRDAVLGSGGGVRVSQSVTPDGSGLVLRVEATETLSAAGPGGFADVRAGVKFEPHDRSAGTWPEGMRAFGHQFTEFCLPSQADENLDRWFLLPFRPNVVLPMWLCDPDGPTLLLAPLDSFHEQVIAVPTRDDASRGIRWGWHGDLEVIPEGFSSSLAVLQGDSPRRLLERWASMIEIDDRLPVDHDALGRSVSYWTDNGAAYWYRTEPPRDVVRTLVDAVESVEEAGVAVGSLQLDSWFYPHETTRPFDTEEWVVPPSGLMDWAPRKDILPDGIEPIRNGVARRPLITHCRHLSKKSPLAERFECWIDDEYAHPAGSDYYEELLDRAAAWGVETFEHDWLVECFLGVRGLRAQPGRARDWQEGIDRAAADRNMTLQWCMATPADFFQTSSLGRVTSIRTSGDHGYLVGPGFLWAWFCYTNALARSLGLAPFKDVFSSGGEHAEVEALLSALSTGPVGLGDAIGTTDADVVRATCRVDGTIIRPDVPIAAVDACFREHAVARPVPLVAECHSDHDAGRWTQVFCANTFRGEELVSGTVDLGPAWPPDPVVALDMRSGTINPLDAGWDVALEPGAWTHHLLAPILDGVAVFGDVTKHAPVGRSHLSISVEGEHVVIRVNDGDDLVEVSGWSQRPLSAQVTGDDPASWTQDDGGRWSLTVPGGTTVRLS